MARVDVHRGVRLAGPNVLLSNSKNEAFFTTLRLIGPDVEVQECGVEEYDCDDATCISKELGRAQISNYIR